MLVQTLSRSDFHDAFRNWPGEPSRRTRFTDEGLDLLYDMFGDVYGDEAHELDVIGICCSFAEYDREQIVERCRDEVIDRVDRSDYDDESDYADGLYDAMIDYLEESYLVLPLSDRGGAVVQDW